MAVDMENMWTNQMMTCGKLWLVEKVPRGPVMGSHVAPHYWLIGFNVKLVLVSPGIELATSG
jgi:hypothetical protein